MIFSRLESRVRMDEGFMESPYLDTENVPTIGYGTTRILGKAVSMNDPDITEANARQLLRCDLFTACLDAQDIFLRLNEMNDVRQEVLVNLSYNIGHSRLSRFVKLIAAAGELDYETMAAEMKDSKWFKQVGQRALRLCYAMQNGVW